MRNADVSAVSKKHSEMTPGERIAAGLDNASMVLSKWIEIREKEQQKASLLTSHSWVSPRKRRNALNKRNEVRVIYHDQNTQDDEYL